VSSRRGRGVHRTTSRAGREPRRAHAAAGAGPTTSAFWAAPPSSSRCCANVPSCARGRALRSRTRGNRRRQRAARRPRGTCREPPPGGTPSGHVSDRGRTPPRTVNTAQRPRARPGGVRLSGARVYPSRLPPRPLSGPAPVRPVVGTLPNSAAPALRPHIPVPTSPVPRRGAASGPFRVRISGSSWLTNRSPLGNARHSADRPGAGRHMDPRRGKRRSPGVSTWSQRCAPLAAPGDAIRRNKLRPRFPLCEPLGGSASRGGFSGAHRLVTDPSCQPPPSLRTVEHVSPPFLRSA